MCLPFIQLGEHPQLKRFNVIMFPWLAMIQKLILSPVAGDHLGRPDAVLRQSIPKTTGQSILRLTNTGLCTDTCESANDGVCDDGGFESDNGAS